MRLSVYTVSLTAALLIPGAAAFADPPWQRGTSTRSAVTPEDPRPGHRRTAGAASTPNTMSMTLAM
jgi:hypothetical protein